MVVVVLLTTGCKSPVWCSTVFASTATPMTSVPVELGLDSGTSSRARDSRRDIAFEMDCAGMKCVWATCGSSGTSSSDGSDVVSLANESVLPERGG